jgi:hypothetical protein
MTSIKAALTIVLKAGDITVAEKEDAVLWQQVLAAINADTKLSNGLLPMPPDIQGAEAAHTDNGTGHSPLSKFANEIGVKVELLQGSCNPLTQEPYLHLDPHKWEAMKKTIPVRGRGSLSNIVIATTILALWFRAAQLGNATLAAAQAVLQDIGTSDANPNRGIQSASWLQSRTGGTVLLNPAEITKAKKLALCFCTGDWVPWKSE